MNSSSRREKPKATLAILELICSFRYLYCHNVGKDQFNVISEMQLYIAYCITNMNFSIHITKQNDAVTLVCNSALLCGVF